MTSIRPYGTASHICSGVYRLIWPHLKLTCIRHGTLCDIDVLKECCRENIGDITFQVLSDSVKTHHPTDKP